MTRWFIGVGCLISWSLFAATPSEIKKQIEEWREQGKREGWTFKIGETPIMHLPESQWTGFDPLVNREELAHVPHVSFKNHRAIPTRWDWRDSGAVTPIRDQAVPQYCGSCWAFATVAVIESLVKIATGKDIDLAEQQLVSCSDYGSCGGGNYAFGFYKQRGAAYEIDFPYKAADVSCKSGLPQNEKVASYAWIGSGYEPTTDEMKAAIYEKGPIAVTVSASGAWSAYKGGIYNECNTNGTNHLVALVGYDDTDQVWILKNSHGTAWGEQGFMRIKYKGKSGYKCNSVGESAMFASYQKPTLVH